jgi:hypothetical protein
MYPGERER